MKKLAALLSLIALNVPLGLLRGWVLSVLWRWFLVPLGLPGLGVAQAWGIATIIAMLVFQGGRSDEDTEESPFLRIVNVVIKSVLLSFLSLLIGYIAHASASAS